MSHNMSFLSSIYSILKILSEESYENQVYLDLDIEDDFKFNGSFILDSINYSILFPNETSK